MIKTFSLIIAFLFFSVEADSNEIDSLECQDGKPEVFFITPNQNFVSSTGLINLEFGIKNFNIAPAGQMACDSGHHHLLIKNMQSRDIQPPLFSLMTLLMLFRES